MFNNTIIISDNQNINNNNNNNNIISGHINSSSNSDLNNSTIDVLINQRFVESSQKSSTAQYMNSNASISISSSLLKLDSFSSLENIDNMGLNEPPSCIVIGCKNGMGYSNPQVKYYQVPIIRSNDISDNNNSIARQWYINTLREDLLEFVLSNYNHLKESGSISDSNIYTNDSIFPSHYVCIEHFDEESFFINNNNNNLANVNNDQKQEHQFIALKDDAVPSLFEIEVFQKMISHQEQIAMNQHQKQVVQINEQDRCPNVGYLSNILSNTDQNYNTLGRQTNQKNKSLNQQSYISSKQKITSTSTFDNRPINSSNVSISSTNKRVRMDPDTRAALIQRVPKAVKRTSLINVQIPQQQLPQYQPQSQFQPLQTNQQSQMSNHSSTLSVQLTQQINRPQKAVKHTMPRSLFHSSQQSFLSSNLNSPTDKSNVNKFSFNLNELNVNSSFSASNLNSISSYVESANISKNIPIEINDGRLVQSANICLSSSNNLINLSTNKVQKAVKHTSTSLFLKEILPPPIMQSTKRSNQTNKVNKAIKHTGGGSNSYYQSFNKEYSTKVLSNSVSINDNLNASENLRPNLLSNLSNHKPLSQLSINNLDTTNISNFEGLKNSTNLTSNSILNNIIKSNFNSSVNLNNANSNLLNVNGSNGNRITMTTTYVYKRVSQAPEIDLNLECEEEEITYINIPESPPSSTLSKTNQSNKNTKSFQNQNENESNKRNQSNNSSLLEKLDCSKLATATKAESKSINSESVIKIDLTTKNDNEKIKDDLKQSSTKSKLEESNNQMLQISLNEKIKYNLNENDNDNSNQMKNSAIKDLISKRSKSPPLPSSLKPVNSNSSISNIRFNSKRTTTKSNNNDTKSENIVNKSNESLGLNSRLILNSSPIGENKLTEKTYSGLNKTNSVSSSKDKQIFKSSEKHSNSGCSSNYSSSKYSENVEKCYEHLENSLNKVSNNQNQTKRFISQSSNETNLVLSASVSTGTNYSNMLAKFYSRRHGAMATALELALNESEIKANAFESALALPIINCKKNKSAMSILPPDLRIGNYPAKCNVCNLLLDNNIELTSHICSHLESGGSCNDSNVINTYISPFDAVTTTCGVCDTTFSQPFDLIKHLDQKHMKQLGEYKCRICERQHSKLSDLISHLNQTHVFQEMPYRCDACGFRTSFYADAIYHIKKEHKSTLRHFCPYCLKSLVLPYSEKLGYVQCNLFYSHLITHFNKHENDLLMPSKCKHCQKCILHVRYMKEHLVCDHSSNQNICKTISAKTNFSSSNNIKNSVSQSNFRPKNHDIDEKLDDNYDTTDKTDIRQQSSLQTPYRTDQKQQKSTKKSNYSNSIQQNSDNFKNQFTNSNQRKRRKSNLSEEDLCIESNSTQVTNNSNSQATNHEVIKFCNVYDFNDQEETKNQPNENDVILNETGRNRFRVRKASTSWNFNRGKQHVEKLAAAKITSVEIQNKKTRLSSQNESHQLSSGNVPYKRKQKALKQTNIKKSYSNIFSKYNRTRSTSFDDIFEHKPLLSSTSSSSLDSNEMVSSVIAGNVRVTYFKNQFKCAECGDTDLKTHFKNDYTCHQCHYNTNCSNSFEYHLHGHLVSKRVALWNKVIKTKTEEYKCPCGFVINSSIDNNYDANTGNKVAAHLIKCEYKYCQVFLEYEKNNDQNNQQNDFDPLPKTNENETRNFDLNDSNISQGNECSINDK